MSSNTETIEVNLESFSKKELVFLINYAHERQITFNQAIVDILVDTLARFDDKKVN